MRDAYESLIIPLSIMVVLNAVLVILIKTKVLQRLSLSRNLIAVLLAVTLIPVICLGVVNERKISSILCTEISEKLVSIGRTRALFIDATLEEMKRDTESYAKNWIAIEVLRQISLEKVSKTDPNFSTTIKNAQAHFNRIAATKGYEDIMLVSAEGRIEVTGALHAAEVGLDVSAENYFKEAKEKTYFTDLFYNTFANKSLMYVVTPCIDGQGRFVGYVVVEAGLDRIYNILSDREGLEETGETYLVNREKLMISESRFLRDTVLKVKVDTLGVNEGLSGKSGVTIYPDYRNSPVFGSWHPIKYTKWVLLAELDVAEAFAPVETNRLYQIALVSGVIIMVVFIAIFSARATARPVHELITVSECVGKGDLSHDIIIQGHDEIGKLVKMFQSMVENLRLLITQTQESISRISSVSMEMLSSSEEQASGSAELAASVGEITATVEELSSSAKQVAMNAELVAKMAGDSELTGNQGKESISESIHIMEEIKETTKDSMKKVASFSEKSQKIGDVLVMIREIASETHLLALNASIEASSAGEFGKRFGVVATEVRRLAERTKAYAEEIKNVVTEIQASTSAAVLSIEQSVKNVDKGAGVIRGAGQTIDSNLELIGKTSDASRQIVMATQQQRSATEQVAATMKEIAEVVKQSSIGLKQFTVAIADMNKLADEFKVMVGRYKT